MALKAPHSTYTIALNARHASDGFARRALEPVTAPLTDYFNRTDLQWYGQISVGTPPQEITVVFDTGSESLEFASTLCQQCSNQHQFNPNSSSTYVDIGRETEIVFSTGVGLDPVVGEDTKLKLRSGTDTVGFGGLSAPNVSVFLITEQTSAFFDNPFDGIMGMSSRVNGYLFARLVEMGLPAMFGMLLTGKDEGGAELTLGGVDSTKYSGDLMFAPLVDQADSHWIIASDGILVGDQSLALFTKRNVIFDSGTSTFAFDSSISKAIYAQVSPEIQPNPSQPGTWAFPCSILPLPVDKTLSFTFPSENGAVIKLTVPASALSVGPFRGQNETCQGAITDLEGYVIIGASVLKEYYSAWDVGNRRLGFAARGSAAPLQGSSSPGSNSALPQTVFGWRTLTLIGLTSAWMYCMIG